MGFDQEQKELMPPVLRAWQGLELSLSQEKRKALQATEPGAKRAKMLGLDAFLGIAQPKAANPAAVPKAAVPNVAEPSTPPASQVPAEAGGVTPSPPGLPTQNLAALLAAATPKAAAQSPESTGGTAKSPGVQVDLSDWR